ncbi:MAG: DMT family transporter [Simkaniaceae bacterium]|nr:DMT family transporter [Simkaniaceae bacterium]
MHDRKKRFELGLLFALISAFFNAFFGFFSKLGIGVTSIPFLIFVRFAVPLILVVPFALTKRTIHTFIVGKNALNQFLRAVATLITQYALFFYLTKTTLLNAMMLWNTGPVFAPIIASLVFKQRIGKATWYSTLVALVGVACILKPSAGIFDPYSIFGLIAGISTGFSLVLYGINRVHNNVKENLLYFYGFASFFSFILLLITFFGFSVPLEFDTRLDQWVYVIYFLGMAVSSVFSQLGKGIAFKYKKPASLSPFFYFSVIIAGVLDWIVFNKTPDFLAVIGAILVVLGSFIKWSNARNK